MKGKSDRVKFAFNQQRFKTFHGIGCGDEKHSRILSSGFTISPGHGQLFAVYKPN